MERTIKARKQQAIEEWSKRFDGAEVAKRVLGQPVYGWLGKALQEAAQEYLSKPDYYDSLYGELTSKDKVAEKYNHSKAGALNNQSRARILMQVHTQGVAVV